MKQMKKAIVIGAGGHGAELDEYVRYNQENVPDYDVKIIGFLDDNPENYERYQFSAPLLGSIKSHVVQKDVLYIVGIANLKYRRPIVERFIKEGANFVTIIHASAYLSPSATIGKGVVIGPMANIGPNVVVGNFTLINSRCSLGHDTVVGEFNFISPNVCFSGFTKIGNDNLFGINSATIPGIKVGNNNKIAAGMVLHQDVGNNEIVFYRYKERIIAKPKDL